MKKIKRNIIASLSALAIAVCGAGSLSASAATTQDDLTEITAYTNAEANQIAAKKIILNLDTPKKITISKNHFYLRTDIKYIHNVNKLTQHYEYLYAEYKNGKKTGVVIPYCMIKKNNNFPIIIAY